MESVRHINSIIPDNMTISELKQKLIQLVRPKRQSYFGVHDIEGIRYLTQLRVSSAIYMSTGLDITFIALAHSAVVAMMRKTMNIFSCTVPGMSINVRTTLIKYQI